MPALLIKELPNIIGIAAILGLIWLIGHGIHENGRKVERADWLQKDNDRIAEQAKELGEAMKRVSAKNQQDLNKTMEVIDERDKALAKLKDDMRTMRSNAGGMWISAKACADSKEQSLPGGNDGTGEPGGADQIRLPGDVEQRLQEIGELAAETVIRYNACAEKLRSVAKVVPNK